jgi:putative MFS transporter
MERKFGIVRKAKVAAPEDAVQAVQRHTRLTVALTVVALSWSFVNFGLLLWLPTDLEARGYSAAVASGILAKSALLALPTIAVAAWLYSRWSSKWTLVGTIVLTLAGLVGAVMLISTFASVLVVVGVIAMLIVGTNGMIAVLLPYAAENYPLGVRGRATGLIAGSSKVGGVAVQAFALLGVIPTLAGTAAALMLPMAVAGALVAYAGRETRGRSLRELEATG